MRHRATHRRTPRRAIALPRAARVARLRFHRHIERSLGTHNCTRATAVASHHSAAAPINSDETESMH